MGLILTLISLLHATETYICTGSEADFSCERFLGGDPNTYFYGSQKPLEGVISLHEFDGYDLANPYPDSQEDTVYMPSYSPFIQESQVPQVFLDPNWNNPDPEPWTMMSTME